MFKFLLPLILLPLILLLVACRSDAWSSNNKYKNSSGGLNNGHTNATGGRRKTADGTQTTYLSAACHNSQLTKVKVTNESPMSIGRCVIQIAQQTRVVTVILSFISTLARLSCSLCLIGEKPVKTQLGVNSSRAEELQTESFSRSKAE